MDALAADNPRAVIGANNPPEPIGELTPFQKVEKRILDLYGECKLWLDGAEVTSDGLAEGIATLLNNLREAESDADKARVAEAKPFDDAKAEIQTRYNLLIGNTKSVKGKTFLAIEACKKALAPWLVKKEAERIEAARVAREAADKLAKEAEEALRARDGTNLEASAAAEELVTAAKKAEGTASKVEKSTAKVSNAGGRAVSLRTVYTAEVTDETLFSGHLWMNYRADMTGFLYNKAQQLVDMGKREIPGIKVNEDKRAQ